MKQVLLFTMLFLTARLNQVTAQDVPVFKKDGIILPSHVSNAATLTEINKADSLFAFTIAVATFPAGAKLDWHYHPGGQILVITDGTGYYQEKGKPKQILHKGDVVKCLPGVEHWHGASLETSVTYMATNPSQKGGTVWLQKVSDEEYSAGKPPAKKE